MINNYEFVHVIKESSQLCLCVISDTKQSNFFSFFKPYLQNCFLDILKQDYTDILKKSDCKLIVHLQGVNNTKLLKDIHYSYAYRQQQKIFVPLNINNLYINSDFLTYFNFLLTEYFNNLDVISSIINPLFNYKNMVCVKNISSVFHRSRIIIIPYLVL